MSTLLISLTLSALPAGGQPAAPDYVVEKIRSKRIKATLTFSMHHPKLQAREWYVFAPVAPKLSHQTDVKSLSVEKADTVTEKSPLQRPFFMRIVRVKSRKQSHTVSTKFTFEATLHDRLLRKRKKDEKPPQVAALSKKEREDSLHAYGDIDYHKKEFKRWMLEKELHRQPNENDVDLALRIYLTIRDGFEYDYRREMNRTAEYVCRAKKSDCGGLSILLVAALRANGVPARMLYGRWAKSADKDEKINGIAYYQTHAIAEFYAKDVGWIPADVSSGIVHDFTKEGTTYFGQNLGAFLTLHVDPNLRMATVRFGVRDVHSMQSPAYWVYGTGELEPEKMTQDWKVKTISKSDKK